MPDLQRPLLIVADVHLSEAQRLPVGDDLAQLVQRHPGHEVVLNGDSFDLSMAPHARDPSESLRRIAANHHRLRQALRCHLVAGYPVTFVAGNHDSELARDSLQGVLWSWLDLPEDAPLTVEPWLLRRGSVHIEHGHLYDPDNAPTHPLSCWSSRTEPLGIALTRRFLVPSGAWAFAHASDTTPLEGLLKAFRLYRYRAPNVVLSYYREAVRLWLQAGKQRDLAQERSHGDAAMDAYARALRTNPAVLRTLTSTAPPPRHHDARETFYRLYLDRSGAAVVGAGAGLLALTGSAGALGLAALSAGYLAWSIHDSGVSRYAGEPERYLRNAAQTIARLTDAATVVMGHTHAEEDCGPYINSGSFAFPAQRQRPYLVVDENGKRHSRHCG